MVGTLSPDLQQHLLRMVLAISEGRGDEAAEATIEAGETRDHFDEGRFTADVKMLVGEFATTSREGHPGRAGDAGGDAQRAENGIRLPVEMTMLGRALLALDLVGRTLDPSFDPNAAIQRNASDMMRRRMLKNARRAGVRQPAGDERAGAEAPGRVNRALEQCRTTGWRCACGWWRTRGCWRGCRR